MDFSKVKNDFQDCRLPIRFLDENPRALSGFPESQNEGFYIDVQKNKKGQEEFALFASADTVITILDKEPNRRHILIMVQTQRNKEKFLIGHDERNLFIAPLGPSYPSNIEKAFECLKPSKIAEAQRSGVKVVRQGEWFFIPVPNFNPPKEGIVFKKESIERIDSWSRRRFTISGINPHIADELIRIPVLDEDSNNLIDEIVYARGKVRHQEHSTVEFDVWHRVYRNLEIKQHWSVGFVD